jgi:hypothetical protein
MPTFLILLNPHVSNIHVAQLNAKRYQNTPLNPSISTAGLSFSLLLECSITLAAITALIDRPTVASIRATVLKTSMHMIMKILLRQSELGMTAGRPSLSCRPTQGMKAGMRAIEVISGPSVAAGSRILAVSSEIRLTTLVCL